MEKFDTHKFLFTLFYENNIKGHSIIYVNRENIEQKIEIKDIEIGPSPLSCKIIDTNNQKHRVMFIRIKYIYLKEELVFDNTDFDISNQKLIKGF